jgi:hypothetical protein
LKNPKSRGKNASGKILLSPVRNASDRGEFASGKVALNDRLAAGAQAADWPPEQASRHYW